jgi:hypothetical protein
MSAVNDLFVPGRLWQRIVAVVLVPLALWRAVEWAFHEGSFLVMVVCGISGFLFLTLSIPPLYARWLEFGEKLNRVVTTFVFGLVYFFFVPLLMVFVVPKDRLQIRNARDAKSFWQEHSEKNDQIREMLRMG